MALGFSLSLSVFSFFFVLCILVCKVVLTCLQVTWSFPELCSLLISLLKAFFISVSMFKTLLLTFHSYHSYLTSSYVKLPLFDLAYSLPVPLAPLHNSHHYFKFPLCFSHHLGYLMLIFSCSVFRVCFRLLLDVPHYFGLKAIRVT